MNKNAPIALFVYKRPEHVRRTVEALLKNAEAAGSELTVFCDGPKNPEAAESVARVREYVKAIKGFAGLTVVERPENLGLARSIISGVTEMVEKYGRVIVMEDDLVSSPHFLRYMNDGLDTYAECESVASIHGYIYPLAEPLECETFFLKGADCWGWATWARAWRFFEPDGKKLLAGLKQRNLTAEFDFDGSYGFTQMLEHQIAGLNNSWAIRWHASAFLRDMLTLYPARPLIDNIGNDASGTHCSQTGEYRVEEVSKTPIRVERIEIMPDARAFEAIKNYYRSRHPRQEPPRKGILSKLKSAVKKIIGLIER